MPLLNEIDPKLCFKAMRLMKLIALLFSFVAFGCNGSEETWSAESRSPDGRIVASARSIETSGFGTGSASTTVYLNWTTGNQQPTLILEVGDVPKQPGDAVVTMTWLSARHLELSFAAARAPIGFQAIRWADVDISVRNTSSTSTSQDPKRPSGTCAEVSQADKSFGSVEERL